MADLLFPDDDAGILAVAVNFAQVLKKNQSRYFVVDSEVDEIRRNVEEFRAAYFAANDKSTRTQAAVSLKDQTRNSTVSFIRTYANIIRANQGVSDQAKIELGMQPHNRGRSPRSCPQSEPLLKFQGLAPGMHGLRFSDAKTPNSSAKPMCAVRLELFMALSDPNGPEPTIDEAKYLRSYTKNPIRIMLPAPGTPKLVTYWGRWADSRGEVGPWSVALHTTIVGKGSIAAPPQSDRDEDRDGDSLKLAA